jgi:hypothetical protein
MNAIQTNTEFYKGINPKTVTAVSLFADTNNQPRVSIWGETISDVIETPALITAPEMSAFIGFLKSLNTGVDVRFTTFRELPAMLNAITNALN